MIDAGTTWASLATPLGIAAGVGWMRCARLLKIARVDAARWRRADGRARDMLTRAEGCRDNARAQAQYLASQLLNSNYRATDLEDRLRKIEAKRHASAKHARAAQLAQQRALKEARTAELQRNVAELRVHIVERVEPARDAA